MTKKNTNSQTVSASFGWCCFSVAWWPSNIHTLPPGHICFGPDSVVHVLPHWHNNINNNNNNDDDDTKTTTTTTTTTTIIIVIIIIIIALKGAIQDFFTISSLRHEPPLTRMLKWPGRNLAQIKCKTSGAHHVQHVVWHLVWRDSSAIKVQSLNHIHLSYILLV